PGTDNFVVIRLGNAGRIIGRVLDANGNPMPNARVSTPFGLGFRWIKADAQGNYRFEDMSLGDYTVSAPAPPAQDTDAAGLISTLRDGSEEEIQAAIGEAFAIFTGAGDPYLNGEGANFNPGSWGFTRARINFDGETVVADIRFLREGTIAGTVLNGQGVPIGARLRLTGIGPLANGTPGVVIRGERNSDPALGTFAFNGQLLVGDWTLQAASPFYPVVLTQSGRTSSIDTDETNVVLQFPLVREVEGRLTGTVFNPDGSPAGAGVKVKISFGPDYVLTTDTNGFFDTVVKIPAGSYTLQASKLVNGLLGITSASVAAGIVNVANVTLLGKGGLSVRVFKGDGTPATNAEVKITQGSYPGDHFQGTTDTNGVVEFSNIFEGYYAVSAEMQTGPTRVFGRTSAIVPRAETASVRIDLTPTGTIRGVFVKADLATPISFAQVAIGDIGFATTDINGRFEVGGIPLGTYRLTAKDAVTGRLGINTTTLTFDGEIKEVHLVEQIQFRGEIFGKVVDMFGTGVVAGAAVTLNSSDPLSGPRTMTTGSDGRFSFPDALPGPFSLTAIDPETQFPTSKSATLPDRTSGFEIDILLQPVASISGTIYQPDGVTPATNATVEFTGLILDTDPSGRVAFTRLRIGSYVLRANSRAAGQTRSIGETNILIAAPGIAPEFALTLRGVGSVSGQVFESDRVTPVVGGEVRLDLQGQFFQGQAESKFTDLTGHYSFENIPVGNYRLVAQSLALAASFSGVISNHFETNLVNLYLGDNGAITGQLVRRDGTTPVSGVDVLFTFTSQSGNPGRAVDRADTNGVFLVENIPVGTFNLEAITSQFDGIAFRSGALSSNGQVLNLGAIPFDEDDPRIISLAPPNGAAGVPITTPIELVFNEALAPGTVTYGGMYLRSPSGVVPGSVQLVPDPTNGVLNRVRIIPNNPLVSLTTYEIIGIDGERRNASGNITGLGVTDLVGRPLVTPFISSFTTADNDPPVLVSIFPGNNAVQIDPRAVMRLSFNEPIRDSNYTFIVAGLSGPVAGTVSVGLNGLVLAFTPTAALEVNATYSLSVSNVSDLAGNAAVSQPFIATFTTLDTLGPVIATLRIADNRPPIAGGTVPVEALLAVNEPSVSVRFSRDLEPTGLATQAPYRANVRLPSQGSTTVRAIATDRYGNDGPLAELVINVVSNQPPIARLLRGTPASGPLGSGETFTVLVSATDDYSVTNLSIVSSGAFSYYSNFFSGTQRTLTFAVPTGATPGSALQFRAQATDGLGALSDEVVLDLEIVDRTPPQLVIQAPADNALLNPPQPLNLVMVSSDNSTNHLLELTVSGALTATQALNVAVSPNTPTTNTFVVSLVNAPTNGASLTATVRATDGTSNVTTVVRTFRLADLRAPRLISANPTNQSVRQSLWLDEVAFNFDEPLDPGTATTNSVMVTNNAAASPPFTVGLENGNQRLLVSLQRPLTPGATYTNTLLPGLADTSSNAWQNVGGVLVPLEGATFIFTTADILEVTPTNGTRIVPGQRLSAAVNFEPGLGASFFRFRMNSGSPVDVAVSGSSSNAAALVPLEIDAVTATLSIEAHRSGQPHYAVGEITLNVRPRSSDDDGDGMANGFEADFNFNPFDPSDAASDADGDTLSNLQEHNLGTSPVNRDTDGDGLRDDVDPEPLNPEDALSPVILTFDVSGIANAQNVNPNYGDRVTNNVMGSFGYGGLDPSAPNIALSYPSGDPSMWTTGYGSLTNVLYENVDGTGILAVKLTADPGFLINLHRFDLAAYTTAFGSDPAITNLQVLDYTGNVLFSTNNVRISRTNFTQFTFSPPLSDNALTIRVNALNLGNLNDDIAIDNIRFSQSGAAPCGPPGLVAAWTAESNGLDAVGANHAALQNGVAFVPGRIGNAFDFDGVDDYVEIPSSAELKPTSEITVAGWINLRVLPAGAIAVKGIDAEAPLDWALTVVGDGRLRTHVNRGGVWQYFDGNTAMNTGTWHHVAMVYDGATLKAYVNGQLDGSQPGTGSIQASEGSVRLGAYAPVNGFFSKAFFSGAIDELSVYGRALGSNEIASIAAGGASGLCPPDQDTDGDGMPDRFELLHHLNPHADDRSLDPDNDGLTNLVEFNGGTFPRDADTDDDGLPDGTDPFPRLPNQAPVPGVGPAGKALALDGVNDLVNLGSWFNYQAFTIAMWIKPGASQVGYADIIDNNHTDGRGWVLQYQNFGSTYGWGAAPASGGVQFAVIPNEWQYLVITHDSNHVNKVYLDGLLIGSGSGSSPINYDGSQFFRIGSWGSGGRHWNGAVDRLAVWTTAHSAEQIFLSSQIAGAQPALAGYWDFNEGTGLLAGDSSTNNRTGTLGGGNANAAPAWVRGLDISSLTLTGSVLHVAMTLTGTDPEGDPVTALITKLPSRGRLYQTSDGLSRGAPITNTPTVVTDSARRVLYAPPRAVSTNELFHYKLTDGLAQSESAIRILYVVADPGSD
ncbi:MAG TPA: LamG-like jellyroll fold domain-containing protein, partial [Verrucomicrobiae bacterium]|nr:LamG-like jellyroll fold domain-containing protein [Verrucomicrobiae bacterium]